MTTYEQYRERLEVMKDEFINSTPCSFSAIEQIARTKYTNDVMHSYELGDITEEESVELISLFDVMVSDLTVYNRSSVL